VEQERLDWNARMERRLAQKAERQAQDAAESSEPASVDPAEEAPAAETVRRALNPNGSNIDPTIYQLRNLELWRNLGDAR
jgi:hypothetical protein